MGEGGKKEGENIRMRKQGEQKRKGMDKKEEKQEKRKRTERGVCIRELLSSTLSPCKKSRDTV